MCLIWGLLNEPSLWYLSKDSWLSEENTDLNIREVGQAGVGVEDHQCLGQLRSHEKGSSHTGELCRMNTGKKSTIACGCGCPRHFQKGACEKIKNG